MSALGLLKIERNKVVEEHFRVLQRIQDYERQAERLSALIRNLEHAIDTLEAS